MSTITAPNLPRDDLAWGQQHFFRYVELHTGMVISTQINLHSNFIYKTKLASNKLQIHHIRFENELVSLAHCV